MPCPPWNSTNAYMFLSLLIPHVFPPFQTTVLLSEERRLCFAILSGLDGMKPDNMFGQLVAATPCVQDALSMLANQAVAVTSLPRTPEKIFAFLDLYRCVHELSSQVQTGL